MLESRTDGYMPVKQYTFLEASIRATHGGSGVDCAALCRSTKVEEVVLYWTGLNDSLSFVRTQIFCSTV